MWKKNQIYHKIAYKDIINVWFFTKSDGNALNENESELNNLDGGNEGLDFVGNWLVAFEGAEEVIEVHDDVHIRIYDGNEHFHLT